MRARVFAAFAPPSTRSETALGCGSVPGMQSLRPPYRSSVYKLCGMLTIKILPGCGCFHFLKDFFSVFAGRVRNGRALFSASLRGLRRIIGKLRKSWRRTCLSERWLPHEIPPLGFIGWPWRPAAAGSFRAFYARCSRSRYDDAAHAAELALGGITMAHMDILQALKARMVMYLGVLCGAVQLPCCES